MPFPNDTNLTVRDRTSATGLRAAIAPDFERAVLGVPGMNFSVLLTRSSNWSTFSSI